MTVCSVCGEELSARDVPPALAGMGFEVRATHGRCVQVPRAVGFCPDVDCDGSCGDWHTF